MKKGKNIMKKDKTKIIIIVVLFVIVLALSGYIIYDKIYLSKEDEKTNADQNNYKVCDYISISELDVRECSECEVLTTLNIVEFSNLSSGLTTEFENKQQDLINQASANTSNEVKYEISQNILSIYTTERTIAEVGLDNYNFYSLNIDLKNNKIFTNEEMLNLFEINRTDMFKKILENIATTVETDEFLLTTDGDITAETITIEEFEENIDTYVSNIDNRIDVLTFSIQNGKLVVTFNQSRILSLLGMGTHMDIGLAIEPQSITLK